VLAESGKPIDKRETAKAIEAQRTQGEKAVLEADQKRYTDAIVMLENIQNHLKGLLHNAREKEDNRTESEKVQGQAQGAGAQAEKVENLAKAVGNKDLEAESKKIRAELQKLAHEAQKDPTTVREKIGRLWGRLEQIKNTLMGKKEPGDEGKRVVV
jgi:molecular chaperone DnaK